MKTLRYLGIAEARRAYDIIGSGQQQQKRFSLLVRVPFVWECRLSGIGNLPDARRFAEEKGMALGIWSWIGWGGSKKIPFGEFVFRTHQFRRRINDREPKKCSLREKQVLDHLGEKNFEINRSGEKKAEPKWVPPSHTLPIYHSAPYHRLFALTRRPFPGSGFESAPSAVRWLRLAVRLPRPLRDTGHPG